MEGGTTTLHRGAKEMKPPHESPVLRHSFRVAAWCGMTLLLAVYAYLAFRQDSSFFSVPWMPHEVARQILSVTNYRNFLGFGLSGFYGAFFLGAWWWIRRRGHWQWGTIVLLALPLVKESLQTLVHTRHGTWPGALYGLAGAALGLVLGAGCRSAASLLLARGKAPGDMKRVVPTDTLRDFGGDGD